MRIALLAPLLLAAPAWADIALPGPTADLPKTPRVFACGSSEWPAIRRAVADYCETEEREAECTALRRALRRCTDDPTVEWDAPDQYLSYVSSGRDQWAVTFSHRRSTWRVHSIQHSNNECG